MKWLLLILLAACTTASSQQLAHPAASVAGMLSKAQGAWEQGRWEEACQTLLRARGAAKGEELAEVDATLAYMNWELLLSRTPQAASVLYRVQPGDSLQKIAGEHGTTEDLIRRMNGVAGDTIRVGQRLKVINQPFSAVVDKSQNTMDVFLGDQFFRRYVVTTGRNNITPVGEWKITTKVVHPSWTRPTDKVKIPYGHPEHRIGTHWLGWDKKGFGIHGTIEPEMLGTQASSGCVRMHNNHVAEVFMLFPRGTVIRVID